ncbi:unnamed protein product [Urochloa decumbens]|uniref:RING-type E3 ubiquitin transferase n=1 Tax=Urochloa decumbens TaxID=240449 RepID=A0ABC9A9J6_9POAL
MGNTGSSGGAPLSRPEPQLHRGLHQVPPPHEDRDPGYPPSAAPELPAPALLERHMPVALKIRIKEKTLRLEPDADGRSLLVAFSFDADAPGSISIYFFAQEDTKLMLKATKATLVEPVTFVFKAGLNQEFKQMEGTGVNLSLFEESELTCVGKGGVFPIALKVQVINHEEERKNDNEASKCHIKFAIFVKNNEEYDARVVRQILWLHGSRYILQEIYGAGTSERANHEDDPGKTCAICLVKPRTTAVLPCRHLCLCRWCAQMLVSQTNKCPICRQPVERLLEIVVNENPDKDNVINE